MKSILFSVLAAGLFLGCSPSAEPDGKAEASVSVNVDGDATDKMERNLEHAGEKIKDGAQAAKEEIKDAGNAVKDKFNEVKDRVTDDKKAEIKVEINK